MKPWKDLSLLEKLAVGLYYGKQRYIQRYIRKHHAEFATNFEPTLKSLDQWAMKPKK